MPTAAPSGSSTPYLSRIPEFLRDLGWGPKSRLKSKWLKTAALRIHSRSSDGPETIPCVLIHGLVISSLYMIPLAECLATTHQVHAVDLPGFGWSEAPDHVLDIPELADALIAWAAAAEIRSCHLIANSLGCQVVAHLAIRAPGLIQTLTLIGATIDPSARSLWRQILHLLLDAPREPWRLWINWLIDFARAGVPRAIVTTRHMFSDYIERQLPAITAPTLIIKGENDPTMPLAWAQEAARLVPKSELLVIPGHAHCVHFSAPSVVAAAIIAHSQKSALPAVRNQTFN